MSIGFFTRRSPGVLISRMTNDIEALNQLVTSGVVTLLSSGLTLVGVVVIMLAARPQAGPGHLPHLPPARARQRRLPHRLPRRLPGDARADRRRHRLPAGDAERRAGGAQLRPGAAPRRAMTELNEANREANMKTVYLNASYFPAVELLAAVGTAAIILYGGTQAIDKAIQIGTIVAFIGYLQRLLRPDPAALPALHDLPAGHGGARQDLRAARHRARHGRRARRDRPRQAARRDRDGGGLVRLRRRRRRRRGTCDGRSSRPARAPRADPGPGRRDRGRQVDLRQAGGALL